MTANITVDTDAFATQRLETILGVLNKLSARVGMAGRDANTIIGRAIRFGVAVASGETSADSVSGKNSLERKSRRADPLMYHFEGCEDFQAHPHLCTAPRECLHVSETPDALRSVSQR